MSTKPIDGARGHAKVSAHGSSLTYAGMAELYFDDADGWRRYKQNITADGMEQWVEDEGTLVLRFCDLMVLSLLGAHEEVRSELAVNFWDEVGEGAYQNRHTELFKRLLRYTGVDMAEEQLTSEGLSERLDWPGLAGYNLYVFFGLHRRNYFRYIGGMGVAEYMDPPQYLKVLRGCRRVGLTDRKALAYYAGHAELDIEHGEAWFTKVMGPLVRKYPETRHEMVQGALMRINTTADYFDYLYRKLAGPDQLAARPAGRRATRG